MNAPHEEASEFAKVSKRENRVYVGNLSYDVKYRDLMEFMRGGGLGNLRLVFRCAREGRRDAADGAAKRSRGHSRRRSGAGVAGGFPVLTDGWRE